MKRIFKSMFLMASAVAVALNFASCKGDEGGDDNNDDDKVVIEGKDGAKYTVKISDLSDNDEELSYTITYNYIAPEEVKVETQNIFKYTFTADAPAAADSTAQNDSVAKPETSDVVKDSLPIVSWKMIITCSKEDYAQMMYEEMKADSADEEYTSVTIDGKTITCVIDDTEGLTYSMVKALYEKEKSEIGSAIAKAKEAAEAEKNKEKDPEENPEKPNTNTKNNRLNLSANANEVKSDSTSLTLTYVNASAGRGVAYSFTLNADGTFASGTVVVAFKDADAAKAYAKSEGKAKNENGDRIYKSVSIDGGNVVLTYSSKALAEMTKATAEAMFNEKKAEIAAAAPANNTEEENNGENGENGEENGEENNTENQDENTNNDEPQPEE